LAVKATTAADRFFCAFANPDDDGGRRGPVAALGDDPAMKQAHIQPDLLYCKQCRRHFRGKRRTCPNDGAALDLVTAFLGQAGDVLDDRYVLVEQIGVGGMGCVYRAYDPQAGRHVALKLLRAEYASNATSAQRFLSEAKLVRLVNHPGVVQLHRFGRTEDGTLLIDMELVDGESVRDRLQRQGHGMDAVTAMQVLDQLLAALVACHDAGVIHCDVKPEKPDGAARRGLFTVQVGRLWHCPGRRPDCPIRRRRRGRYTGLHESRAGPRRESSMPAPTCIWSAA
jgi:hypothetical protein